MNNRQQQNDEQREQRLRRRRENEMSYRQQQNHEQQEGRLRRRRERQQSEAAEQREERLARRRQTARNQHIQRTTAEREEILQRRRETRTALQGRTEEVETVESVDPSVTTHSELNCTLSVDNADVVAAMTKFHARVSQICFAHCTTCNEGFPSVTLCSQSSECVRCSRDKRMPKLYSGDNNMDPGTLPVELQVIYITL